MLVWLEDISNAGHILGRLVCQLLGC